VRILGAVVGILVVLVIADRVIKSRSDESDPASPRARYADKAKIVQSKRDLVADADAWAASLESTRSAWAEVQPMLVRAPTPDLAVAGFRDDVLAAASAFDLPTTRVAATRSEPISGAPGLHLLELRLEIQSHAVPDVVRLVDRLENLPHRITGIVEVRLDGPGPNTAAADLGATVVVQSIGYVAPGGAS
jgi:hypothetical protein